MEDRVGRAGDFAPMDLGVRAAKVICDRFGAQVTDYSAEGRRASITLRMPSRRELLNRSLRESSEAVARAEEARRRSLRALELTEATRNANLALRSSLTQARRSLAATRSESRRILNGPSAGSAPAGP